MGIFPKPVKLGAGSTRWRASDLEAWENQFRHEVVLQSMVSARSMHIPFYPVTHSTLTGHVSMTFR